MEALFPLDALKHEQVKNSTTAEYLLADKNKFNDIAEWLILVNEMMLTNLIEGMKSESIKSETDEEKNASNSYQTWMLSIIKFKNQWLVESILKMKYGL